MRDATMQRLSPPAATAMAVLLSVGCSRLNPDYAEQGAGTTTGTTTGTTGDGSTEDGELDTGGSAGTTGDSDVIRLCGEPIAASCALCSCRCF